MFTDVNQKTSEIAGQVGQTPQGWNGSIFSMIEGLSNSVIMPIAGIIITFVLCYDCLLYTSYLCGAEFEVRAAEDICTPDHQKDADGNRIVPVSYTHLFDQWRSVIFNTSGNHRI